MLLIVNINVNGQKFVSVATGLAVENQIYLKDNKTKASAPIILGVNNKKKLDVPLDQYLPGVLDQGNQGACTAFAVAEALSIRENYLNKRRRSTDPAKAQTLYSPAYLWVLGNFDRPDDQGCLNPGISYSTAFSCIFENKLVSWGTYPYRTDVPDLCYSSCPPDVLSQKITDRKFAYHDVKLNVEAFKKLLKQGYPICIATNLDMGFYNALNKPQLKGLWSDKKQSTGQEHAMVVVDYDDERKCFKVLDSHGPNVGDSGFIWLPYKLVNPNMLEGVVYGCYIVSFEKATTNGPLKKIYYVSSSGSASNLKVVNVEVDSLFKGKIVDNEGNGIPGVTIKANGFANISTMTNASGDFQIKTIVDNNYIMQYVGMTSTAVNLGYENKTVYEGNTTIDWIKEGYYRIFNALRFGVVSLNHSTQSVVLSVTDDNSDQLVVNSIELHTGETTEFEIYGKKFRVKLDDIKPAGNPLNFLNPNAAYLNFELISEDTKLTQYF